VISLVFFTAMFTVQVSMDNAGWYMMLMMLGERERERGGEETGLKCFLFKNILK